MGVTPFLKILWFHEGMHDPIVPRRDLNIMGGVISTFPALGLGWWGGSLSVHSRHLVAA